MPIYLDHAATTAPEARVIDEMMRCMRMANPSAAYSAAGEARRELRLARQQIARMLHVDHTAVYFTSCGSEANAWAMRADPHAAVSAIEHASVLHAAPNAVRIAPNTDGVITPESVERALTPDIRLISVQWANNETGVLQPIADIYPVVKKHGALFHVDAVQAFGHVPVDARHCDMLTLSAHKFCGPRGAGCLYIRPGVRIPPLIPGTQESGRRGGTENVPAVCGMRVAAEMAEQDLLERMQREEALMNHFLDELAIPGMRVLGGNAAKLPGVRAIHIPGLDSETAIARLDLMGIQVSGGAACQAGLHEPSHVYLAMGLSPTEARQVLRISIGRYTTSDELHQAAQALRSLAMMK
ncbi:MAG: cysteine desulfurase [Clostridia bacterium]|nr:cysteine desulfurase [Clostridia bacterium]